MRIALLIFVFCVGCAHVSAPIDGGRVSGIYRSGDPWWPRMLDLREDGTYDYLQMTDVIKEGPKGEIIFEGGWALVGRWTFVPPASIEMTINGRAEKITVVVRASKRSELAILEPDLFPDILRRWKDDGSWGYLKKEKPNKAPEPTPGSVTPRAGARVAPAPVVAHL